LEGQLAYNFKMSETQLLTNFHGRKT